MTSQGDDRKIVVTLQKWPGRQELIFTDDGFGFRVMKVGWDLPWSDIFAMTLHREHCTDTENHDFWATYLDFWPANEALTQRRELAWMWDTRGYFHMNLSNGDRVGPEIHRAIYTFRPDLWRGFTTSDNRWRERPTFDMDDVIDDLFP